MKATQNQLLPLPFRRPRGSGIQPFTVVAAGWLIFAFLLPSIPEMVNPADDGPTMCACGCGKPKGRCCCSALRTSQLALGCSEREDPNKPVDTASDGKIIGPPEPLELSDPLPVPAKWKSSERRFTDLDPEPEVPPPRV